MVEWSRDRPGGIQRPLIMLNKAGDDLPLAVNQAGLAAERQALEVAEEYEKSADHGAAEKAQKWADLLPTLFRGAVAKKPAPGAIIGENQLELIPKQPAGSIWRWS